MSEVTRRKREVTPEHKEALSLGRDQSRAVKRYLEVLSSSKPKRGRKRTRDSVIRQLEQVNQKLAHANPLTRLQLLQQKVDLEAELLVEEVEENIEELEAAFLKVAAAYGARKGISYQVWREVGVSAEVLGRAGIKETRTSRAKAKA